MRMGEKTHFLISDYLKNLQKNEITPEKIQMIKENIAEEMKTDFELSKKKDYENLSFESWGGLSEHFYQENIDNQLIPTIEKVWNNLEHLISSPWKEKIEETISNSNIIYIENPRNPDFESMKVNVESIPNLKDISIMASPDFWVIFSENNYLILDRKSGKEPQDLIGISDQIKVYALKLLMKKNKTTFLNETNIEGYEIYLPSTHQYGGKIRQKDIDEIIEKIIQDINFQKTFLIDQDTKRNEPLSSTSFSRTNNEKKCETCSFRKVCTMLKNFE